MSLPPPLMTSDPGSFARATIVERKPQIIAQVIADHGYPQTTVQALHAFRDEIAAAPVQPLPADAADAAEWNAQLQPYAGCTWLELPWYLAETYFYRRLLAATGYFAPGRWQGRDPFAPQKRRQEAKALARLDEVWDELHAAAPDHRCEALLHSCLWGNRADLSNLGIREQAQAGLSARAESEHLLIDHTEATKALLANHVHRLDFVCDNVGLDFLFDLALADFVLAEGWVEQVIMHLKPRPFFVSDVMPADADIAVAALARAPVASVAALGKRLQKALAAARLQWRSHPFWASARMFPDLPDDLRAELATSDLIILKGDVNYRRLLDDRHWPYDTPFESIATRFALPTPFLALRTLKGEIMVGLQPGEAERLAVADPAWLLNGKRGVIHLVGG